MIVVEFRRPTQDARVYLVAATVTVDDGGAVTITGDPAVVPTHAPVGQGVVSFAADPVAWLAQVGGSPSVVFVIPVVVARTGTTTVVDPHRAARDANRPGMARLGGLVLPAPKDREHRRPRSKWRSRAK